MKRLFILLLISTFSSVFAQSPTNFNGTYTINKSKTDFRTDAGQAPDWVLPVKFKVTQSGNNVTIVRTIVDDRGVQSDRTYIFAGDTPSDITTAKGSKIHTTLQWNADKTAFTLDTKIADIDPQSSENFTEVWSLNNDSKLLVLDRNEEQLGNGLKYHIKGYYEKN